jgi:hypothetical protein
VDQEVIAVLRVFILMPSMLVNNNLTMSRKFQFFRSYAMQAGKYFKK